MVLVHLGHQFHKEKIAIIYGSLQILLIILFGIFARYGDDADAARYNRNQNDFDVRYGLFQDVHIMIFIGFGFLMTFLKRYGFSAIGFNFLLSALAIQWSILIWGLFHLEDGKFEVNIMSLIGGDFAAGAILVSFGVVIGKTSPLQLLFMTIVEVAVFNANLYLGEGVFGASDAGGSMFIHMFGAYFGLACSFMLRKPWQRTHKGQCSSYNSDLFAMIGSLFLWICWPTFNGALLGTSEMQHRTAINTYMSLAACVTAAFATSLMVSKQVRLEMDLVQNATLAGGVAVGTMANFMIQPWGAMLIGTICGIVSVCGFHYLSPFLADKLMLHDTCGVHNLHGMPGLLGGVAGIIAAAFASPEIYQKGLRNTFHHRQAMYDAQAGAWIDDPDPNHHYRTAGEQAGYQALGLVCALAIAIVSGLITGFIMKLDFFLPVSETQAFHDEPYWHLPEDVVDEEKPYKYSQAAGTELDRQKAVAAHNAVHAAESGEPVERNSSQVQFGGKKE